MAIITSIAGPSKAGKTRSFKNLDWDKAFIIRPNRKPLSFAGSAKVTKQWDKEAKKGQYEYVENYAEAETIMKKLVSYGKKIIIIDDSTHFMTDQFMATIGEKGYDKFNEMAFNYHHLIKTAQSLPDDVRVYLINHIDLDVNGNTKIKTIGKMLDEKIDIPTYITICLGAMRTSDGWRFRTQTTGRDFYGSPEGMFDEELIDNDLKFVDDSIVKYYDIKETAI